MKKSPMPVIQLSNYKKNRQALADGDRDVSRIVEAQRRWHQLSVELPPRFAAMSPAQARRELAADVLEMGPELLIRVLWAISEARDEQHTDQGGSVPVDGNDVIQGRAIPFSSNPDKST